MGSTLRSEHADSARLADALVRAAGGDRKELVIRYRDTKGVQYTEALAVAVGDLPSGERDELRDALAERMVRMTAGDPGTVPERRAGGDPPGRGAWAWPSAGTTAHTDRLAELLLDPDPLVGRRPRRLASSAARTSARGSRRTKGPGGGRGAVEEVVAGEAIGAETHFPTSNSTAFVSTRTSCAGFPSASRSVRK